jgi:hypothetical protein
MDGYLAHTAAENGHEMIVKLRLDRVRRDIGTVKDNPNFSPQP